MRVAYRRAAAAVGTPAPLIVVVVLIAAIAAGGCRARVPNPVTPTPPTAPPTTGLQCGVERWAVKTLSDQDARRVNVAMSTPTTVSALTTLPPHCSGLPSARTFMEEFVVYEVEAVIREVRPEDDRDFHIVLEDPAVSTDTIVAELADPACMGAVQSPHLVTLAQAHMDFMALFPSGSMSLSALRGKRVRVRGVGFFDFNHGQIGRARSCIELHPIVAILAAN